MAKERRIWHKVHSPFGGIVRADSAQEIAETNTSVASEIRFEQGYFRKREGRTAVGGTDSSPLGTSSNRVITHVDVYRSLWGDELLLAHTIDNLYRKSRLATSFIAESTDLGSDEGFYDPGPISSAVFAGNYYFTALNTAGRRNLYKYTSYNLSRVTDDTPDATAMVGKHLAVYGERLVHLHCGLLAEQRVYWSDLGDAETYDALDFVDLISQMGEDYIVGGGLLGNTLTIFGRSHIVDCAYTGSATSPFAFSVRSNSIGLYSPNALVCEKDAQYFADVSGLYIMPVGSAPQPLDKAINRWLVENWNVACLDKSVMIRNDRTKELVFYYPSSSSTVPDKFVAISMADGSWTEGTRDETCAVCKPFLSQLMIDELSGYIDNLSGTIDAAGSTGAIATSVVGDINGTVWYEFLGNNLGTSVVDGDYETKDFTFDDEGGACFMSLEHESTGNAVTISYSVDEGTTWTSLTETTLTSAWVRYRQDFEVVGKMIRFRFQNNTADSSFKTRWYRFSLVRGSSLGTLPT